MKGMLMDAVTGDLVVEHGCIAVGDTEGLTAAAVLTTMRGEQKSTRCWVARRGVCAVASLM